MSISFGSAITHQFQASKILQHGHETTAKNLHSLFRVRSFPVCQITDRALGSVGKSDRNDDIGVRNCIQTLLAWDSCMSSLSCRSLVAFAGSIPGCKSVSSRK